MDLPIRVIPCLDVAEGRVVKGVKFKDLRDEGDPVELARKYYDEGADELTFLDVTATVQGRQALLDVISATAEAIFIPLTVGGGVRSVDDVRMLLEAGADKVSVASAAVARPALLEEISSAFGSQVLVASLDIRRNPKLPSGFEITTHGGSLDTALDAVLWSETAVARGAGELLLNSIDADGTQSGFDLELISAIRSAVAVPVIASGGAGSVSHFVAAAAAGVDAVLAASVFHRNELSIAQVKAGLSQAGFEVREVSDVGA